MRLQPPYPDEVLFRSSNGALVQLLTRAPSARIEPVVLLIC